MSPPLDDQYLAWLYSQIESPHFKITRKTYWKLLRHLYKTEFTWSVRNDENRAWDGLDLRYEFLVSENIENPDRNWMELECSMLEMLIAISRRMSFESESPPWRWFWELIGNIRCIGFNDSFEYEDWVTHIDWIFRVVLQRQYWKDGRGGLFPLRHPTRDQRKVELWYQMNAYLDEDLDI
jgi:hypothetical protein